MIIAIDGPAGAGKSTIAKLVAKKLGFLYLDTGAMYRALTLKALDNKINLDDPSELIALAESSDINLNNKPDGSIEVLLDSKDVSSDIRLPRITQHVSDVAKIKEIRELMLKLQRELGSKRDAVLEGRDIGTVVFPDADNKFYLDANFNERAARRLKDFEATKQLVSSEDVQADLRRRDQIDSNREVAPLRQAEDAVYIDSTNMNIDEVVQTILKEIHKTHSNLDIDPSILT